MVWREDSRSIELAVAWHSSAQSFSMAISDAVPMPYSSAPRRKLRNSPPVWVNGTASAGFVDGCACADEATRDKAISTASIASAAGTQGNGAGSGAAKVTRLEKACHRIPAATTKVTAHIAKLQADASTRGSIAWLQDRITKAQAKNHPQAVTMLQAKLAERQAALTALQARLTLLTDAAAFCVAHGVTP